MEADTQLPVPCGMLSGPWRGINCAADSYFCPIDEDLVFRSSPVKFPAHIFSFLSFFLTQGEIWSQGTIFSLAEWICYVASEGLKKNKHPSRCSWKPRAEEHMGSSDSPPSVQCVTEISHLEVRKIEELLNYVSRECC